MGYYIDTKSLKVMNVSPRKASRSMRPIHDATCTALQGLICHGTQLSPSEAEALLAAQPGQYRELVGRPATAPSIGATRERSAID